MSREAILPRRHLRSQRLLPKDDRMMVDRGSKTPVHLLCFRPTNAHRHGRVRLLLVVLLQNALVPVMAMAGPDRISADEGWQRKE
ncbi:hypothetical protein FA95DRAFT_1557521 [Auriscalpium vulgare]|uniref:Uncharacterized protein n=1 Tax=Auriscalpium vulgare TaxID=40419 RepID=A0ACB8RXP8_9AGAM|nr:hypothetical protein FA95DRAFT_1557521 [Auriscalpium vulgare]